MNTFHLTIGVEVLAETQEQAEEYLLTQLRKEEQVLDADIVGYQDDD
jgi:extradiol dioxygenase family protein